MNTNNISSSIPSVPLPQNTNKKTKKKSEKKSNEQQISDVAKIALDQKVNLDLLYYRIQLARLQTSPGKKETIEVFTFCVPCSQIPGEYQEKALEKIAPERYLEAMLSKSQRLKLWRDIPDQKIFEVLSLKPLKIHGMDRVYFYQHFGNRTLLEILIEDFDKKEEKKKQISINEKKLHYQHTELKIKQSSEKFPLLCIDLEEASRKNSLAPLSADETIVLRIFESLKSNLSRSINKYGSLLFPDESMLCIWDHLSQLILNNYSLDRSKKAEIAVKLLEFWENIYWNLGLFMQQAAQNPSADTQPLVQTLDQLQNIQSFLDIKDKRLIHDLLDMQSPLCEFLEKAVLIKTPEGKQKLAFTLYNFAFKETLSTLHECKVIINSSKKGIRSWLETHAATLESYLNLVHVSEPGFKLFIDYSLELKKALQEQNWLEAYQLINSLTNELGNFGPLKEKNMNISSELPYLKELTLREKYNQTRCFHFAQALMQKFTTLIAQGKLFNVISETAYQELFSSYQVMLKQPLPTKKIMLEEFKEWAIQLKKAGFADLFNELKNLENSWTILQTTKEQLLIQKNQELFQNLADQIQDNDFSDLPSAYLKASQILEKPLKNWVAHLRKINECIRKSQDFCMLMIANSTLPALDISILQTQFKMFNQSLEELVKPTTRFLNAFQQLICMDVTSSQELSENSISLRFTDEGSFTLNLFETDEEYFIKLKEQLAQTTLKKNQEIYLEVEEEVVKEEPINNFVKESHTSNSNENNEKELKEKVNQVFRSNTKTHKILKGLTNVLKEFHLPYSTEFGGRHYKLYINGVPIPLPTHTEWKPGTLKSIQNELCKHLTSLLKC